MAISLEKVQAEAPHMVPVFEAAKVISLQKGLNPSEVRAAVMATIDCSYSAQPLYASGEIQKVVELAFASGLVFDDDGSVPVSLFDNYAYDTGEINLCNCHGFIGRQNPKWGGTSYVAALEWIIKTAGYSHIDLNVTSSKGGIFGLGRKPGKLSVKATTINPFFAIFVTDGDPQDGGRAAELLIRMSQLPIFIQFIGVGPHGFDYLRKLDKLEGRLIDNAGFFDSKEASGNNAMLNGLLNEFPSYIKEAKQVGLIR